MLHRQFGGGGVVYKEEKNNIFFLVRKTTPNKNYPKAQWRLPKGWLDDENGGPGPLTRGERKAKEEELQEAALREVREETGVRAKIIKKIGTHHFFFTDKKVGKILKFVTFYLMEWVEDLPEGFDKETSEVRWLPYSEARKILSIDGERKTLDKAKKLLDSGV